MSIKTTFIIGAGASKEANLPTGYELKGKISRLLDIKFDHHKQTSGDYIITNALENHVKLPDGRNGDINPFLHEAWHIKEALPLAISIDNFIDAHKENTKIELCGKLGIIRSILDAEKGSLLYINRDNVNNTIHFSSLEKSWYIPFFQLLTENCRAEDLKDRFKLISLIVFNYDRCIEHFLKHAIQNYYRIPQADAEALVKSIEIYHPYGSIGNLPWMDHHNSMEFGTEPNGMQLLGLSNQIKTFTEGTDPNSSEILAIRQHMVNTKRIVFIGFAFHKLNMELITPDDLNNVKTLEIRCYATTYGISESDKNVINDQIDTLYENKINKNMANLHAGPFFNEFWRSLSF